MDDYPVPGLNSADDRLGEKGEPWLLEIKRSILTWNWPDVLSDPVLEIGVIVMWAMWVGRAYLNLDPMVWPYGADFPLNVQPYFLWSLLKECGACVLWNGTINGGAPAFGDPFGPVLHPLVVLSTVVLGAIDGAKIAFVGSLAIAGVAQWWLARVLQLGSIARLWSAGMAVAGGHLMGRMEMGWIVMVLSIATGSLVIAAGLEVALTASRRASVMLGIVLALTMLAGQVYIQVGVLLGLLPAFLVFLFDAKVRVGTILRGFAVAGVIAILLTAIYWLPLLHFQSSYSKSVDVTFSGSQPIEYIPLNLVIKDLEFYRSTVLAKKPMPAVYVNYIGWMPIVFAVLAFWLSSRSDRQLLSFFLLAIVLIYLCGSAITLQLLASWMPMLAGLRHPALIASLAIPLVLALAAWGSDQLMKLDLGEMNITLPSSVSVRLGLAWIVAALPMAWGLRSAYSFSQTWATISPPREIYNITQAIDVESTEWVSLPFGEFAFLPVALDAKLKVTMPVEHRGWAWKERQLPPPYVQVTRDPTASSTPGLMRTVSGVKLIVHPQNEYATIKTESRQIPCEALARGGNIDVICATDQPGTLVVHENRWSGWTATQDGSPISLGPGQWLSVPAVPGEHHYEFRYRPWDVMLGLILSLVGVLSVVWLWFRRPALETRQLVAVAELSATASEEESHHSGGDDTPGS